MEKINTKTEVEPEQGERIERQSGSSKIVDVLDARIYKEQTTVPVRSMLAKIDKTAESIAPFEREGLSGLMVFQHASLGQHILVFERTDNGLVEYDVVCNQLGVKANSVEAITSREDLRKVIEFPADTEVTTSVQGRSSYATAEQDGEGAVSYRLEMMDDIRGAIADYALHDQPAIAA